MKAKLLNFLLFITSLIGYLEWGKDSSMFLFQAEAEVLRKLFTEPSSAVHPFTLIPLLGQVLLVTTLLQKQVNKIFTFISIFSIGILLLFMFFIGSLTLNYKILLSTIPFLAMAVYTIFYWRRMRRVKA